MSRLRRITGPLGWCLLYAYSAIFFQGCERDPTINAIAIHPTKPRIIYTAMKQGVYKSRDGGETWTAMNQGLEGSPVRSLAIDPVLSSTIYAGTFAEAVFKSLDGGQKWHRANIGLKEHVSVVNSFAFHPLNRKVIYIGTTVGVYKTTNAAGEWHETVKGMESVYVVPIITDPSNPSTLYCGTSGGMYKSLDGGKTWLKINKGLIEGEVGTAMALGVNSIVLDPRDDQRLFIGTGKGIYVSTDGGSSWSPSGQGLSDRAQFVAVLVMDPRDSQVLLAGTGKGVYKSTDGGKTWGLSSSGLTHMVLWSMAMDPKNPDIVFAGTQGGLFRSTDGGNEWVRIRGILSQKSGEAGD